MTVANIAWMLAVAGRRVLAVDWNLRAPRLLEFLHPFWPETDPRNEPGVIDALWQHILEVYRSPSVHPSSNGPAPLLETATKLNWHFNGDGAINIVNAGYPKSRRLRTELFPYEDLFQRLNGQHFIDRIRASAAEQYDYVLIDSPLVLDDYAGICCQALPDVVAICFTFANDPQAVAAAYRGVQEMAKGVAGRSVEVLLVATRTERAQLSSLMEAKR